MNAHALAEARSLAAHRLIADWIRAQHPRGKAALRIARERVARWERDRPGPYVVSWARTLEGTDDAIADFLERDDPDARAARQCTPFAGALSPRERWALWDEVRERVAG